MNGLVSLSLFVVIFTSSDALKKEIVMSFAGLPIDKGVRTIIEESSLEFDQWKTQIPFTDGNYTETWQAKLPEYKYLNRHNGRVKLIINKESLEGKNCYDLSIQLTYQDGVLLNLDYEELKSNLLRNGAIIEESTMLGTPIVFKSGILELEDEVVESIFTFSMKSDSNSSGMTLSYEVCSE